MSPTPLPVLFRPAVAWDAPTIEGLVRQAFGRSAIGLREALRPEAVVRLGDRQETGPPELAAVVRHPIH